jgi:GNAT superfamily N-acetyltransferase
MDIRVLDASELGDEAVMREFYDLNRRSETFGREQAPFWPFEEFLGAYRTTDSGELQEPIVAYDGDRIVATATMWTPLVDNTDKAYFEVNVDPQRRRRGIGRALTGHLEQMARDRGRTLLMTGSHLPYADREDHAYTTFAAACGYELSNIEVVRHLDLAVPDECIQQWIDRAAPHHEGYTIETFVGAVPDDLVESLCALLGQLAVDAPTGSVDFEAEVITPERYAEWIEGVTAMRRVRYETVALTTDREVVAQSTLAMPLAGSEGASKDVYQWGTFVHRDHRGHHLGLATKAVNLRALQAARSDLTRIITQNAETNGYMVAINEQMGFYPVEVKADFVKRL